MAGPRHIYKFVSADGTIAALIPLARAEFETSQPLLNATAGAIGMDYAVDLHRMGRAPLGVARETVRALITAPDSLALDSVSDQLVSDIQAIGRGQLWSIGADASERWSEARAVDVARPVVTYQSLRSAALTLTFERYTDWRAPVMTAIDASLRSGSVNVAVTNTGNGDVHAIQFVLSANAAGGFATPAVTHQLTGETWASTRTAANGQHKLRVDSGDYTVERTTDNGATWSDDYGAFSQGALQVGFMRLLPGTQTLVVTGCPNAELRIEFWPVFR